MEEIVPEVDTPQPADDLRTITIESDTEQPQIQENSELENTFPYEENTELEEPDGRSEVEAEGLESAQELLGNEGPSQDSEQTPSSKEADVGEQSNPNHGGLRTSLEDVSVEEEPTLAHGGLDDDLGVFDGNFTLDHYAEPPQGNNASLLGEEYGVGSSQPVTSTVERKESTGQEEPLRRQMRKNRGIPSSRLGDWQVPDGKYGEWKVGKK